MLDFGTGRWKVHAAFASCKDIRIAAKSGTNLGGQVFLEDYALR